MRFDQLRGNEPPRPEYEEVDITICEVQLVGGVDNRFSITLEKTDRAPEVKQVGVGSVISIEREEHNEKILFNWDQVQYISIRDGKQRRPVDRFVPPSADE